MIPAILASQLAQLALHASKTNSFTKILASTNARKEPSMIPLPHAKTATLLAKHAKISKPNAPTAMTPKSSMRSNALQNAHLAISPSREYARNAQPIALNAQITQNIAQIVLSHIIYINPAVSRNVQTE